MTTYTANDLASRAGVSTAFVDKAIRLGIIGSSTTSRTFSFGDLRRVRLFDGLDNGGIPLEALATAVQNGDLSFGFFDLPVWERFRGLAPKTLAQVSAETGLDHETLSVVRESMGYARPTADELVREDELPFIRMVETTLAAGVKPAAMERLIRVWGESLRKVAEADSNFFHAEFQVPLLQAGLTESQTLEAAVHSGGAMGLLLDEALLSLYRAQSEHTWLTNIVEAVEATLERTGLHHSVAQSPAVCFVDLTGYTQFTEEQGDEASARIAAELSRHVYGSVLRQGGRPVKWLGDGVMNYFNHSGSAVLAALDMVERIPAGGLPAAHIGIDSGPVVLQDGDYFGRTVNIAARIAGRAEAGQVLVSQSVVAATVDSGIEFAALAPAELKGIARPIQLYQASRAS